MHTRSAVVWYLPDLGGGRRARPRRGSEVGPSRAGLQQRAGGRFAGLWSAAPHVGSSGFVGEEHGGPGDHQGRASCHVGSRLGCGGGEACLLVRGSSAAWTQRGPGTARSGPGEVWGAHGTSQGLRSQDLDLLNPGSLGRPDSHLSGHRYGGSALHSSGAWVHPSPQGAVLGHTSAGRAPCRAM